MKRFLSLLTVIAFVGITQVWGANQTVTWTITGVATSANGSKVNTNLNATKSPNTETGTWKAVTTSNSYAATQSGAAQLGSKSYSFNGTISLSGSTAISSSVKIKSIAIGCKSGGSYTIQPKVGGTNFDNSQSINGSTVTTKTFTNSTGMSGDIVLYISTSAQKHFTVSSISVTYEASVCNVPTSPTNSSITSTGFTAGWTAPSSAPGSGYLVAYATATSTTPGDNITASSGNYTVAAVTSGTSKTYTGLTPGTTYHWWVRSKCSSTDLSGWVAGPDITIPKITASATITGLDYNENEGPSTAKTFTVSGSGLTGNLTVTAPTNFEVCKTQNGTYTSSVSLTASGSSSYNKSVSSTTIYVRLASGKTEGTYGPSNVTISGGSASSNTSVSVKGIVSAACTATPEVGAASLNGSFSLTHLKIFHHIIMSMFASLIL